MTTTYYPEGLAAIANEKANGFSGVTLGSVGVLENGVEVKRLSLGSVQVVTSSLILVSAIDDSAGEYACDGLRFYTDSDIKFVLISSDEVLQVKTAASVFLLSYELDLTPAGNDSVVPSGDPYFLMPAGTQQIAGGVRYATDAEADSGIEGVVLDAAQIAARYSKETHGHSWNGISDKPTAFPPENHGHSWSGVSDKPTAFPPENHGHSWSGISDKPTAFPPENHSHSWNGISDKPTAFPPETHSHKGENTLKDAIGLHTGETVVGANSSYDITFDTNIFNAGLTVRKNGGSGTVYPVTVYWANGTLYLHNLNPVAQEISWYAFVK